MVILLNLKRGTLSLSPSPSLQPTRTRLLIRRKKLLSWAVSISPDLSCSFLSSPFTFHTTTTTTLPHYHHYFVQSLTIIPPVIDLSHRLLLLLLLFSLLLPFIPEYFNPLLYIHTSHICRPQPLLPPPLPTSLPTLALDLFEDSVNFVPILRITSRPPRPLRLQTPTVNNARPTGIPSPIGFRGVPPVLTKPPPLPPPPRPIQNLPPPTPPTLPHVLNPNVSRLLPATARPFSRVIVVLRPTYIPRDLLPPDPLPQTSPGLVRRRRRRRHLGPWRA